MKKVFTQEEIKKAMELAEKQFNEVAENKESEMVYFKKNGIEIVNPWIDCNGIFDLTMDEAIEEYGEENVNDFIKRILNK